MSFDNATIHLYASSPYIVKACVNLRDGAKIRFRCPLKDEAAAWRFLHKFAPLPVKIIHHA